MDRTSQYMLDTTYAASHRLFAGGQWVNDTRSKCPGCDVFDESSEPNMIHIALNHLGRRGFVEQLWNSHSLPIIREDLVDLWQKNRLTGLDTKPVSIVGWFEGQQRLLPRSIPNYYRLITTSKVKLKEPKPRGIPCRRCGFVEYDFPKTGTHLRNGVQIDQASWDEADFCGVQGYEFVFLSRRAAELTLASGIHKQIALIRPENWCRWKEFDIRTSTVKEYRTSIEQSLIRRVADL